MNSKITYLKKLELFKELDNYKDGQFFAIADQRIKNHLPQWIQFSPHVFWLKSPEEEKNLTTFGQATEFFLKNGIQRSSRLYAFGGGATTDLAGFVAATILRGISWCAVPTTLLAMIDGSIGGKVGINMPQGKNQVGAFHLPEEVYICGDFLTTLTEKDWISGKGEMLKYGFLSEEVYQLIVKKAPIEQIAHVCALHKTTVVEKDFKEEGERILLNLGHTFGHAFEPMLKISHGHAVAMGLRYLLKVLKMNDPLLQWDKMARALSLPMEKYDIAHFPLFDVKAFINYIEHDKKKSEANLRLVLVKAIGSCYVEEVPMKEFKKQIQTYEEFKA
jgi:3-dehydroquinate synthase